MKKSVSAFFYMLVVAGFVITTLSTAYGGYRNHGSYYGSGHRSHHSHYKYNRHHHYASDYFWTSLGIGLLTGVIIQAIATPPPPPRTIVYAAPPPVVVQSQTPIIQYRHAIPPIQQTQRRPEQILRTVKIDTDLLNVRFGPDLQSSVIAKLHYGAEVGVIGAAPEWLYIRTHDGQYGWVLTKFTMDQITSTPVG